MNWERFYDRLFYILLTSVILATVTDFLVTYTVYSYVPLYFIANEANSLYRVLIPINVGLAVALLIITNGLAIWMIVFLRRSSVFLRYNYRVPSVFAKMIAVILPGLGTYLHLVGAIKWVAYCPLPFIY